MPAPLPHTIPLDLPTVGQLSLAERAVGRLAGAGRLLPNPHLFLASYLTEEALASSRMEGTQASLTELFDAAALGETPSIDVREVQNYVHALEHGLARLPDLPVSKRLLCEMHRLLLVGVRGQEKTPGEFRRSQNWIGSPDNRPETALFVPPTVENMWPALDDWEKYVHEARPELPLLVRTALLHYQFETIHPFLDGNGRLGRLFIVLYLVEQGLLPAPLLPLSAQLERTKSLYIEHLQGVRERGDVQGWLRFFLSAVADQANRSVERAERMTDLRERYRSKLRGNRSRAGEVVDLLFGNPVLTTRFVVSHLGVTSQGASHLLRQLTELGVLREDGDGRRGVRARWYADEVLEVLEL
ncbi:Fic family protein [Frankia sp. Cr2]|uniref:Fic family protein n=1 Tax=Frankia sp. Cr2 TaxID=3073932 RepID=UPI002AD2DEA3|nr:Fic/DOC family N-terminal domain-containing protein [Frankia sp. Cr2]